MGLAGWGGGMISIVFPNGGTAPPVPPPATDLVECLHVLGGGGCRIETHLTGVSKRWENVLHLFIYLALPTRAGSPQQHMPITVGPFCLTHPVNFPCGRKPEYPEETHDFRQSVDFYSFHMRTGFESH